MKWHFVGIGGAGMSALAQVCLERGETVTGSDARDSPLLAFLRARGARIRVGLAKEWAREADIVVYTTAIRGTHPELEEASARGIRVRSRQELLVEWFQAARERVAVSGSHGKSTTTAMLGWLLWEAGLQPTVLVGAQTRAWGGGGKAGEKDFVVAELDESQPYFVDTEPTLLVLTNLAWDHMEAYPTFGDLQRTFEEWGKRLPGYGRIWLALHEGTRTLMDGWLREKRALATCGPGGDLEASEGEWTNGFQEFAVRLRGKALGRFRLPYPGRHWRENALLAAAAAGEFGVPLRESLERLADFPGLYRRWEVLMKQEGRSIVTDYAHHPEELARVLEALPPESTRRVIFQPHRYTRTRELAEDFARVLEKEASVALVEVYAADEPEEWFVSAREIVRRLEEKGCRVRFYEHPEEAVRRELEMAREEWVLFLGAGDLDAYLRRYLNVP